MYDTLMMIKPGSNFTPDEMHRLVSDAVTSKQTSVQRFTNQIRVVSGSSFLSIDWNTAAYVIQESDEIADRFQVECRGCRSRFEMNGRDTEEMVLFNDYLLINERLEATGAFVIFDSQEGKLLFD